MSITPSHLPDWWQREKQRRLTHLLILLLLLLALIAYFWYQSLSGRVGMNGVIDFDTSNSIVFVRQENNGKTTLYDIRADGTSLRPMTPAADDSDKSAPNWSIDGTQLFYASNRDDRKKMQIYIRAGGDIKQLTYGTGRKESPFPTPDGKRVAFLTLGAVKSVYMNGNEVDQILPPPRMGGNETDVAGEKPEFNGPFLNASFSSDGQGIAGVKELSNDNIFTDVALRGLTGGDQIVEVKPPGSEQSLPLVAGNAASIAWEPNGKRLMVAFGESPRLVAGKMDVLSGLFLFSFENPKQPTTKPLILNPGYNVMPRNIAWSSDGKKIAFEAWWLKSEKVRQLMGIIIMGVPEETQQFQPAEIPNLPINPALAATPDAQPHLPRWSPDGSRLLYQVTRKDGKNDLWVINADFTNPLNLTKGQGDNTQGVWSPAKPK